MTTRAKRDAYILKLMGMANALGKEPTWDEIQNIWTLCSDWNSKHEDAEIFMCEISNREDEIVNGFMIEDDVWYFEY